MVTSGATASLDTDGATHPPVLPLVSCILPTKNRARYIPEAIRSYQSQTYARKELVIVDNGSDDTESLLPPDSSIHYSRAVGDKSTGAMRNLCVARSQGTIICHFDSDDWSAPERVTDQVTRLGLHGVVTGYHSMLFYDERDGRSYLWRMPHAPMRYVLGTSLCYRRAWWEHHPFRAMRVGEDMRFWQQAMRQAFRLTSSVPAEKLMVARVHDSQTSRKTLNPTSYTPMPEWALPPGYPCVLTSSAT